MGWFRGGYYGSWYAAFGSLFARWVGDHPQPLLLAIGCFVFAPLLLLGVCVTLDLEVFAARQAAVADGRANRRAAVAAGVLGAIVGLAVTAGAGGLLDAIGGWALPLLLAAPVVGWWTGLNGLAIWAGPAPGGEDAEQAAADAT